MNAASAASQPSPVLFFETINAYQRTAALKTAIELDLFTAIGEGAATVPEVARRSQAAERGVRILCDYLVVIGFLTKSGDGYGLPPDTAMFLDRRSHAYLGGTIRFLGSPMLTDGFKDLTATVRKGGTVMSAEGSLAPEHPMWVEFARSMMPLMALPAELMAGLLEAGRGDRWKVLDIAAGHGLFGITLARHNPNAQIVAVDWANVLEVAQENARAAGVADRYRVLPGSAFDADFGEGYDVVLLTNLLHHFDPAGCEALLRKVHAALRPGGRAAILEFVPNDDRISPPIAASFALIMLSNTPAGDAYTFGEYREMFRNAGFSSSELHPLPPTLQHLVIGRK
jgi:ubiquinone/menaquinone biosynthesis C-methylase UbiE